MNSVVEKELEKWFIRRNASIRICRETDYIQDGAIDSFGFVELIAFIEEKFEIRLNDEDLRNKKFRTLQGLAEIVARYIEER